jgi:hypothetical protein
MIIITFYNDGYITRGHSDDVTCTQISAMQYIIEGSILEVDEKAKCKDGEKGTGLTALLVESELALKLLDRYKEDIKVWLNNVAEKGKYKIEYKNENLDWNMVNQ